MDEVNEGKKTRDGGGDGGGGGGGKTTARRFLCSRQAVQ